MSKEDAHAKKKTKKTKLKKKQQGDPHVVSLYDHYETDTHFYLVMELCEDGDMWSAIDRKGEFYSEKDAAQLMVQIIQVVAHAHLMGVFHRDLKVGFCVL